MRKSLNDNKYPIIWFYDSKDSYQKLLMHTFSNNEKYRASVRFAKVADPSQKTLETYQIVANLPYPVGFLGIDGTTYKKATISKKDNRFSTHLEFVENLHNRKISEKLD